MESSRLPWWKRLRKIKPRQNDAGREVLDPTPMAPPVGYKAAPSLADQIREMVRSERLARDLAEQGIETFEEADDFDVGDDYDPRTPFEETFDPEGRSSFTPIAQVTEEERVANEAAKKAATPPKPVDPPLAGNLSEPPKAAQTNDKPA